MDVRRENTDVRWVGLRPLVETNPSNFRIFPMDICLSLPHGTTLKALIRMLIHMFLDVR